MEAVSSETIVSVEDYLEGERSSEMRHEYFGGIVYAMAGASRRHNALCLRIASALLAHLQGKPCQVAMDDVKLRLRIRTREIGGRDLDWLTS